MNLSFSEQDWQRTKTDYSSWWAGELDRPLVFMFGYADGMDESILTNAPRIPGHLPAELSIGDIVARYTRKLEHMRWYGDGFPFWWPNFGPGVATAFLGQSEMNISREFGTIWFEPHQIRSLDTMEFPIDENNGLWNRVRDLTKTAAESWAGQVCVGYTDLGGNLDLLAVLRTADNLLYDTMDTPELLGAVCQKMTGAWLWYFRELHAASQAGCGHSSWGPTWAPGSTYMLQSDFAYMIAPQMFEEFVLPDLDACCNEIDFPFYHLDGKGQLAHLDLLCSMEKLRGIQWVPGAGVPSAVDWPDVIHRITGSGKLCQIYATPEEAIRFFREYDGKGVQVWVTSPMSESDAADFLKMINQV